MRGVLSAFCIVTLIGCARVANTSSPLLPATNARTTGNSNFKTIFVFESGTEGRIPAGSVIGVSGTLYGATTFGGVSSKDCVPGHGCGTVYAVSQNGDEQVIYRFTGYANGARPYAGLVNLKGTLYGTTQLGGKRNNGSVFGITTSGSQSVLHEFDGKDGSDPRANLTAVEGALYGTTYYGGSTDTGTVFAMTTSGTETVLHNFEGGTDGALPLGAVLGVHGLLYGTTSSGGIKDYGTVFSVAPSGGKYRVVYKFQGGTDGEYPYAGLTELKGVLYGTTQKGGEYDAGTVFSITPGGSEAVLHSFGAGTDGTKPFAGLTVLNGHLYGTTAYGGSEGDGTIYTISPTGSEEVLHNFTGAGGRVPYANLTVMNGALYGTTVWGGRGRACCGIVYKFSP